MKGFEFILVTFLLICAIGTALSKKLLNSVVIFSAYSIIMSVIWMVLESPDLAITEAAVGAGVTSVLFYLTLRRIHAIDEDAKQDQIEEFYLNNEKNFAQEEKEGSLNDH